MPIIKSAKKKLRQDKRKQDVNEYYRSAIRKSVKQAKKATGKERSKMVQTAYSVIGKAAKKKVIHKNKANRLKSRISKLLGAK